MTRVWYNKNTGEICTKFSMMLQSMWWDWKHFKLKPTGWRLQKWEL